MFAGGLFLIYKSVIELHETIEHGPEEKNEKAITQSFWGAIGTIMVMDIVFSLDSVITAIGMVNNIPVMIAAIVIAMGIMITMVNKISDFISLHPTIKVLALSFLLLIGFTLVLGSAGFEVAKGFIYFSMAFSIFVETLNIKMHSKKNVRK